jgi:hypothetical protein
MLSNLVAIIKRRNKGPRNGKAIKHHFTKESNKQDQSASLLCIGCKIAIEGRNFNPTWNLYSRAGDDIEEIVFEAGANPNHGSLPKYIVVDFPEFNGPVALGYGQPHCKLYLSAVNL